MIRLRRLNVLWLVLMLLALTGTGYQATAQEPPVNQLPLLVSINPQVLDAGQALALPVSATDPDGDVVVLTAASDNAAVALVTADPAGQLLVTLTGVGVGNAVITLTVDDGRGGVASTSFGVTVNAPPPPPPVNQFPMIDPISGIAVESGQSVAVPLSYSDPDGDALSVTVATSDATVATAVFAPPSALSVSGLSVGMALITVTVDDGRGGTNATSFAVTVTAVAPTNQAPMIAPVNAQGITLGQTASVPLAYSDPDGDAVALTVTSDNPSVATVMQSSAFELTIAALTVGTANVSVQADDGHGGLAVITFAVTVNAPLVPVGDPTIVSDKLDYAPGEWVTLTGTNWQGDTQVRIIVNDDYGSTWRRDTIVSVAADGTLTDTFWLPSWFVANYSIVASGQQTGRIVTSSFTDMSIGTYDQCSNDQGTGYPSGDTGCRWINGNLQSNNSRYFEGDATVQRLWLTDFAPGSTHTVTLVYGTTKGGKHAYDFLTTWNWSENWITEADRCEDIVGCVGTAESKFDIPQDPNVPDSFEPSAPGARQFVMRGGSITAVSSPVIVSGSYAGDSETSITITFTVANSGQMCSANCAVALWFGAHVAAQANWGLGLGAGSISGSPYHVALDRIDNASVGQRDNQMQAGAVTFVANGTIVIVKDAIPNTAQDFSFNLNNNSTISQNFSLDDDADPTLPNSQTFSVPPGTWTASELNLPSGWALSNLVCIDPTNNTTVSGATATINLASSETVICTYTNSQQQGTLRVIKNLINDNGGTAGYGSFSFSVNPGNSYTFDSDGQIDISVSQGTYTVTELSTSGYSTTYNNCTNVSVPAGGMATCTITNDDQPGTLIVRKLVINDNGGTASASAFSFSVNGGTPVSFEADGQNNLTVNAGTYTITEPAVIGYTTTYNNCSNLVIPLGGTATCTITNDDQPGTLIVEKVVINDNGGILTASDFTFSVNGAAPVSFEADGQNDLIVNAGTYTITEPAVIGYTTTYNNCSNLVIPLGGTATCTITNDDQPGTLIVEKVVVNDNGGTLTASAFTFSVNGGTAIAFEGDGQNDLTVSAGVYTITEPSVTGYTTTYDNCSNVVIPLGGTATCTITNDDQPGTLIVKKVVVNDNGGTLTASDFTFSVNSAAPVSFEADGQNDLTVDAGEYTIIEPAVTGYTTTYDNCSNVVIPSGGTATCTITNDDQPGTIIVEKQTVPDGLAGYFEFTGDAAGTISDGGQIIVSGLSAGQYTSTELVPVGWQLTGIECTDSNSSGDVATATATFHVANGETVRCTFTNDPLPTVMLIKNAEPTILAEPGGAFTFTVRVINTSAEPVTITAFDDTQSSMCDNLVDTVLEVGAWVDCSYTITHTEAGTYPNTASVIVKDNEGNEAPDSDDETVTVTDELPQITVEKTAAPTSVPETGGNVVFTFTVTNNSVESVTITSLSDSVYGPLAGDADCQINTILAVGASCSFSITQWVEGDFSGPDHVNVFTATAKDNENNSASDEDDATVDFTNVLPTILVTKTANPTAVPETGGNVTFTFEVKNTSSEEPVTITSLEDSVYGTLAGDADCAVGTILAAGASCEFAIIRSVEGDYSGPDHVNVFTAIAEDNDNTEATDDDDATVDFTNVLPSILVTKTANPTAVPETGGNVTFTFEVKNTSSEEPVTITSLSDSIYGTLAGDADCAVGTVLAAGASCEFAIIRSVEGDYSGPDHVNVFTAKAVDNDNTEATDDDDATVDFTNVLPTILVTKTANPTAVPETGGDVTFTFVVQNTSSEEPVTITSLEDSVYDTLAGDDDCKFGTVLAAGASCTFELTAWVEGNYSGPDHVNVFTAKAVDNDNTEATDDDDATVDFTNVLPTILVTKTANPTAVPETGGSVTFTFTVQNTSSEEPVTITSLSDTVYGTLAGDADCAVGTVLAAGASCEFAIIRSVEGDYSGPDHVNVFTAKAVDNDNTEATDDDDATVDFTNVLPTILVTKTANPTAVPETGGSVTFTFTVQNTSSEEPVTITSLSDTVYGTLAGDADCAVGTILAAGASCTFELTQWVEGDFSGPDHVNVFTAHAEDNDHTDASDTDDATVDFTNVLPTILVTKTANPTAVPETGGDVTFTFVVKNTSSEEPVTITSLSDSVYGTLNGDADCEVGTVLAAGASCEFAITEWVEGDFSGADHVNVFTAIAVDNDGSPATDDDGAIVDFTNVLPTIEVTKTANPTAVLETGGDVTFTFVVQNTSSEEPVTITSLADSVYGTLAGDDDCQVGTVLVAGASCSFSITQWVEGDFSGPDHVNVFTAKAVDNDNTEAIDDDDATVDFTNVLPTILVTKTADPTAVPETGGDVTFTFEVKNTSSEEPVTITSLEDSVYGTLTGDADCAVGTMLAAGASCEFAIIRSVEGDYSGPYHVNVFTAIAEDNDNTEATDDDDATVDFTNVLPTILVTKTANPTAVPETGGNVTFTFTVQNTSSEEPVTITSLSDSVYGTLAGDDDCKFGTVLAAGASCEFAITRSVEGDYSGSSHVNVFTAHAVDNDGTDASDTDDATVDFTNVLPTIFVTKTANPTAVPETGGDVTFTFVVQNTSSEEPVTITSLSDSVYGTLAGDDDCKFGTVLAAGASCSFSITQWVEGDFSGPDHVNVFTATAVDNDNTETTDDDDATVDFTNVLPTIFVTKTANPTAVPETGGDVTFTFVVQNTSSEESVTITSLSDSVYGTLAGDADCAVDTVLAAGASCSFSITQWVEGDFSGPDHVNVFTAKAVDNDNTEAIDDDDATVDLTDVLPDISVEKSANPTSVPETGGNVTFTVVVTNHNSEPVTLDSLTDSLFGDLNGQDTCATGGTIAANGGSYTCTFTEFIAGDYESGIPHENTVTAEASDDDGNSDTATDSAVVTFTNVTADINIVKVTVDGATSGDGLNILTGESIKWRYTVTNAGNYPLSNVTVTDNQLGVAPVYVSGDANGNGKLDLTETWIYEASGTAVTGNYSNTGTAHGEFTDGAGNIESATASDTSSYFGADPQIAITKVTVDGTTSGDGLNILTGEAIAWRYSVSNVGNVPLSSVTVTDNRMGVNPIYVSGDTNGDGKLDLSETWIFEASGTAVTGNYSNTGTASGSFTDSAGHSRTDSASDSSSYFGADPQIAITKVTVDGTTSGDGLNILTGESIKWRYSVTNVGNIPLSSVSVTDNQAGVTPAYVSGDANSDGKLDLTETWIYEASGTAVTGDYSNTGTASGSFTDSAGHSRADSASDSSSYFGADPQIVITKVTVDGTTSGDGLNILTGESIKWRYTVTNVGNIPLSSVTVIDDQSGVTPVYVSGDTNSDDKLDLTETWIFEASGTAVTDSYSNTGTASGSFTDSAGHSRTDTASDSNSYFGADPQIAITKVTVDGATSGDTLNILTGEAIKWRYTVTNIGNVPLSSVTVADNRMGVTPTYVSGDTNGDGKLDLSETWIFEASGTAVTGNYSNTGTASGSFTDSAGHSRTATATDSSSYFGANPQIDIVKKTVGSDGSEGDNVFVLAGAPVTWHYYVTNTGNVALSNVSVTDNQGVAVTCPKTTLAVGESMTCTATGTNTTLVGNWYNNTGTATGSYSDDAGHSRTATDSDTSSYYSQNPGVVTNSSLCDFGSNFTLVFTPDVRYYTSSLQAYKLSDSNPGQFFYNVFQTGGTGTVTLTLPYPYVTQGATPIHVYSSLTVATVNGQNCLVPTNEIKNYQTQVTLNSYPANTYNSTTTVTLTGLPTSGFMYINIHLDYGLEKLNGWVKSGSNANFNRTINPTMPQVNIINNTQHTFTSSIANSTDSIFNQNEFKRVRGFGGLVSIRTGYVDGVAQYEPLVGAQVILRSPTGNTLETITTDVNGWYLSNYIHNGKASTYTVRVLGSSAPIGGVTYIYGTTGWQSVSVGGSNKFGEGNFQITPAS